MRARLNPTLLTLMVLWGFNFVALKLVLREVPPVASALVRGVLMMLVLAAVCRSQGVALRYPEHQPWRVHLQGFLAMGLYMLLFTIAMGSVGAAEGAIILGTGPVFTLILAVLVGQERFRPAILLGTLLAFAGVGLVAWMSPQRQEGGTHLTGVILMAIAAFTWAASTIVSKPLLGKVEPLALTTLAMPAGIVALLPMGIPEMLSVNWAQVSPTAWFGLFYFTVIAGALGFFLFYRGVSQVGAAGAMLYQYLVSPIAALTGYLVLGQKIHPLQIAGFAIVVTGVLLANRARHAASPPPPDALQST